MFTIIGLLIVFGSVLGGFALESGPFHTLVQPAELLVIGGAAVGTIVVAAPGRLLGSVFRTFLRAFSPKVPTKAEYLELLLDSELDTHHEETAIPVGVLKAAGDSLPGLGIVAAVLGIVITMGALDQGPEEIGHHIAAALIGTFLGILLCYGLIQPLSSNVELQEAANGKYLRCIKEGVIASLRGAAPSVAVEFARKAIFSDDRPSSDETEAACRALKQQAS